MKVLKPGRPQRGWTTEKNCTGSGNGGGGCGALLQVEVGDLYTTESHCRDETDEYVTFRCPCGVETDLTGSVPRHVLEAARLNREGRIKR